MKEDKGKNNKRNEIPQSQLWGLYLLIYIIATIWIFFYSLEHIQSENIIIALGATLFVVGLAIFVKAVTAAPGR